MPMDIAELARKADINKIVPLSPAMLAALERFAGMVGGNGERYAQIVDNLAEQCGSRPMKSALLSAAEAIRNEPR